MRRHAASEFVLATALFFGNAIAAAPNPHVEIQRRLEPEGKATLELRCDQQKGVTQSCELRELANDQTLFTRDVPVAAAETIVRRFLDSVAGHRQAPSRAQHQRGLIHWNVVFHSIKRSGDLPSVATSRLTPSQESELDAVLGLERELSAQSGLY